MLEGKAKKMFEEYFHQTKLEYCISIEKIISGQTQPYYAFMNLADSMQFGVYVDWADSIGIHILSFKDLFQISGMHDEILFRPETLYETRAETQKAAITKLSELVNNKYKGL